ncbi:MAG: hypothetical protein KAT46_03640 [Deltaproteobacteria bacterium]|nr:hypothetical protein [Deltaproteobacteria bacterium]
MKILNKFTLPLLTALLLITVSGCIPKQAYKTDNIQAKDFKAEITALKAKVKTNDGLAVDPELYYKLCKLYSTQRNPKPDFKKAIKSLKKYIELNPSAGATDDIQDLLSHLNLSSKNNSSCLKEVKQVKKELKKERRKLKELKEDYDAILETINKLQDLDLKIEGLRKEIK